VVELPVPLEKKSAPLIPRLDVLDLVLNKFREIASRLKMAARPRVLAVGVEG
jgi:hypothetical protein